MKIDRLMGILTILLRQDKATAPELARRFEVSRRTVNRDIDDLCRAGVPLVTTQGHGGGISIAPGYKLDKTLLTRGELQAVLAGLGGVDSVSKTAGARALAEKLSPKDCPAQEVLLIDLASHYKGALTHKIGEIKRAIENSACIAFCYYAEKGESQRRVEPYRLVYQWADWYVLGFCLGRQAFRLFKLNRLWGLSVLDTPFRPRPIPAEELDFSRYFAAPAAHLKALFEPGEKYRLIEEYGPDCCTSCADGALLLERDFASYEAMRAWVFSFGARVRVLAPEVLRADRRRQARAILEAEG